MKRTLYLKFILAYLLFGIFGFILVATFVSNMVFDQTCQRKADDLYREAVTIANTYAADLYSSDASIDTVSRQLTALSSYLNADLWILNPSGRVVVKSGEVLNPSEEVTVSDFDPSVFNGSVSVRGTFFGSFDEERLSVLAPITSNYKTVGYVTIHTPVSGLQAEANRSLNIAYLELVFILLLSLIILIFFTEIVYQPLRRITKATQQYAAGNMRYPLSVDSEDEMGYLAASLSYMANEIASQEEDQKKFIANVSHDFRSPLTSIRGFLEAMLDGTIPPENHEKYLKIVLNETDRLTKLTNGLLSLNTLGSKGVLLNLTDFDINDMIRQVAASFEETCRRKSITFHLVLSGNRLIVTADADKIQQVLYNLIDNAIKFSHEQSAIRLETSERHNKVFVSVKDNGIGIPKADQKLVFDRFYKTDLSRGKDKKGTGLGLSIVREIIQAHGENINLISTEGVGSEFIFTLRRSAVNDSLDDE